MKNLLLLVVAAFFGLQSYAQLKWKQVTEGFGSIPPGVRLFSSTDSLGGEPSLAWYLEARLSDVSLEFSTDTSQGRRLTPQGFFEKNGQPLVVVNSSFFSFASNQNLGMIVRNRELIAFNVHSIFNRADSHYYYVMPGSFGITKNRVADVDYVFTDTNRHCPLVFPQGYRKGGSREAKSDPGWKDLALPGKGLFGKRKKKWKMETAVAGGPVLLLDGKVHISNNEERKFMGKAINDRHPRTAIGYTRDGRLILLMVEGRNPGKAAGASLTQLANILLGLGCVEALNLDGGGSSCMLVNGKETIRPSDKEGQRPVPGVLLIRSRINP